MVESAKRNVKAMFLHGRMLVRGEGIGTNESKGKEIFTQVSVRGGESYCWANLSLIEADLPKKRMYCLQGAKLRDFRCLESLGMI